MSSSSHQSPDVAVVGGGAIGLAVAWRAAQRGLRVAVFDADPSRGAWNVAAGMLAPVTEARLDQPRLLELGLASARAWPGFAAELTGGGDGLGFTACGTLLVARDRDEAEALEREAEVRRDLGLGVRRLLGSEARELEPALASGAVRLALELEGDHAVDPRRLVRALTAALERAGGTVHAADVAALSCDADRVRAIELADGTTVAAGAVVIAAGAWSSLLGGLPGQATVPVRPVKGQVLRLRDPAGPGLLGRVLRVEGAYVVPRGDGGYVVGATVEERGFDMRVSAGGVLELLREADRALPGLRELELEEVAAGVRPATSDNAPALGPGALAGLHWATGHYRNGILLAPLSAEMVVAGLVGERPHALAAHFDPNRFAGVPA